MKTKVSIIRCKTYDLSEVQASVARAFEVLGGISSFVKEGERVLLKPNILSICPPERGVNTHVEVVRACVRIVREKGAIPFIGDNPGGSVTPKEVYESSGFASMAKEEGVELAEVKNVKIISGLPIASYFFECDKIISLPKMKTHDLMTLTGAVKNMYGAVSGLHKTECHKMFPKPEEFAGVLVDAFKAVRPNLVLMDGIIAMDGDGPASGRLKNVGLLIAGGDSVAVDSVFSHLIGMEPLNLLTTKEAGKRNLGEADLHNIDVLGEDIDECFIKRFKLPGRKIMLSLPVPIIKALASRVKFRPYIDERGCKKCMICEKSCPVCAITIDDEASVIDYGKCIKCMCCHEVCPYRAVVIRRNVLAKVFRL